MAEERNPAGHAGLGQNLSSLAGSGLSYLQSRLELAGLESREAGSHYLKALLFIAAGVVFLLLAYLLLLVTLISALALLCSVSWIWTTLGVATFHLVAGVVFLLIAKGAFNKKVFSATLAELKKDQAWITARNNEN